MALVDLLQFPHFIVILIGIISLTISILFVLTHKPEKWFILHKLTTIIGIFLVSVGVIILGSLNLLIVHGIIGLISVVVLILTLIIGLIANKKKRKNLISIHIWLSRVIYTIAIITAITGILAFV